MGITRRLSQKLNQVLGEEAEDLVSWMDRVDAQRSEWREAISADIAELWQHTDAAFVGLRRDFAGLRQEVAGLKQELGDQRQELGGVKQELSGQTRELGGLRQEMQVGFAELRREMQVSSANLRQEMAQMEARFERRFSDLIKWSFVFWVGAVGAIAMLAEALP